MAPDGRIWRNPSRYSSILNAVSQFDGRRKEAHFALERQQRGFVAFGASEGLVLNGLNPRYVTNRGWKVLARYTQSVSQRLKVRSLTSSSTAVSSCCIPTMNRLLLRCWSNVVSSWAIGKLRAETSAT